MPVAIAEADLADTFDLDLREVTEADVTTAQPFMSDVPCQLSFDPQCFTANCG